MLFKKKIQRLCDTVFLWYRKYKYYTLVFTTKQGQWNQPVVFAKHAFPKPLIYLQMLSLKTAILQVSKWTQWTSRSAELFFELFQPTRCCRSQRHRYSQTSMTVSTAAVTVALRPPLARNSSTLWTQEPSWGPRPAEQARAWQSSGRPHTCPHGGLPALPRVEELSVQPGLRHGARGRAAAKSEQTAANAGSPASQRLICRLPSKGMSSEWSS